MRFFRYGGSQAKEAVRGVSFDFSITARSRSDSLNMAGSKWGIKVFSSPDLSLSPLVDFDSVSNPSKCDITMSGARCCFKFSSSDTTLFTRGLVYCQVLAQIPSGGEYKPLFYFTLEVS